MARSARRRSSTRNAGRAGERLHASNGASDSPSVPPASTPAPSPITRPAAAVRRRSLFSRRFVPRSIGDIWSELRKVTWPSLEDVRYLTVVVAIVAIAVGVLLGGVDLLFGWAIEQVFFS